MTAMIHVYPNKAGQLKLLLEELKESFDEQNRYFSQVTLQLINLNLSCYQVLQNICYTTLNQN